MKTFDPTKPYTTFEEATNRADMNTVACIKVTFSEGEGLVGWLNIIKD